MITSYVKEHYAEDISLQEIARLVSLNPDYFTRFFKKYMGMTFLDYVNSVQDGTYRERPAKNRSERTEIAGNPWVYQL